MFWQRYMAVCYTNKATLHDLPSISIFNQCLQYSTHGRFPLDEGQLLIESSNFQPSRNLINNLHLQLPDNNMASLHDLPWISYMEVFRWRRMNCFPINCCNIPRSFPEIWSAPINNLHLQCSETSNSMATLHGLPWIFNSIFATLNMEVSHWRIN